MRLEWTFVAALALSATAAAPVPARAAARLTVYAASSMQDALRDIGRAFRTRHEGVEIEFSFAGSSTLRAQIDHGAPADVFVSADTLYVAALHVAGLSGPPSRFATNRLVLVTRRGWIVPPAVLDVAQSLRGGSGGAPGGGDAPAGAAGTVADRSDLGRVRNVLKSLARPGARIALVDSTVPAGRYAARVLERMAADPLLGAAFRAAIEANVASRETGARAVLARVALGEADAGFVYATDALAAASPVGVTVLPPEYAAPVEYAAAVVPQSRQAELAKAFVAFLGGDHARSILRRHGFGW
jgi:molybdate transport system substrate-binding protein